MMKMGPILKILIVVALFAGCTSTPKRFPNELSGYHLYSNAKWQSLTPLVSSMAAVIEALGPPDEKIDLANYSGPYPGDNEAEHALWRYDNCDKQFNILVYFVRPGRYNEAGRNFILPDTVYRRLYSIAYIPKQTVPFKKARLSTVFLRREGFGAEATWEVFADGSGLEYQIYTSRPQYGDNTLGDISRIVYGPTDEQLRTISKEYYDPNKALDGTAQ